MDNINLEKLCRTCITEQSNMLTIFDAAVNFDGINLPVIKIITTFVADKFTQKESYPTGICTQCMEQAIIAYKFKLLCDRSENFLQTYTDTFSVKQETSENIYAYTTDIVFESMDNKIEEKEYVGINNNTEKFMIPKLETKVIDQDSYADIDQQVNKEKKQGCSTTNRKCKSKKSTKVTRKEKNVRRVTDETVDNGSNEKSESIIQQNDQSINGLDAVYFCVLCKKSFKNKYIYSAHEKRHEYKGQFLCNVCGKGFSSQSCLSRHNRVHTGEKNYECEVCHKRFPSSNNLNLHSRTHSGLKPYLCTVCGKRCSHPTGLTYHMRTHTKEKPFSCDVCGKRFAIQCHFDRHKKIHSGERPFPCNQCEKAFIKKVDLQRHEATHSGIKPHACKFCNKSFVRKMHLNYHMMVHTEERPHTCSYCGKGFIRNYYLKDHINKHHK